MSPPTRARVREFAEAASQLVLSDAIRRAVRLLEQELRRGAIATRLAPEQREKLPELANPPKRNRLRNMRWLDDYDWEQVINAALLLAYKSNARIPSCVPAWVINRQELRMGPFEWWWTQRVKAAFRTWKNNHITPMELRSRESTLRGTLMRGEAALEVTLVLERNETRKIIRERVAQERGRLGRKLTGAERAAILEEMRPGLENNVSKVLTPGIRAVVPKSSDLIEDSKFRGVDAELHVMAGPGSFRYVLPIAKLTPEEREQNRTEIRRAIARLEDRDQENRDTLKLLRGLYNGDTRGLSLGKLWRIFCAKSSPAELAKFERELSKLNQKRAADAARKKAEKESRNARIAENGAAKEAERHATEPATSPEEVAA